jgi:hypothetical protein
MDLPPHTAPSSSASNPHPSTSITHPTPHHSASPHAVLCRPRALD